jgi:hypothetical protein
MFRWSKASADVEGWQPYRHLWADCLDSVRILTSHSPIGLHSLLRASRRCQKGNERTSAPVCRPLGEVHRSEAALWSQKEIRSRRVKWGRRENNQLKNVCIRPTECACKAIRPRQILWVSRTQISCRVLRNHWGAHSDPRHVALNLWLSIKLSCLPLIPPNLSLQVLIAIHRLSRAVRTTLPACRVLYTLSCLHHLTRLPRVLDTPSCSHHLTRLPRVLDTPSCSHHLTSLPGVLHTLYVSSWKSCCWDIFLHEMARCPASRNVPHLSGLFGLQQGLIVAKGQDGRSISMFRVQPRLGLMTRSLPVTLPCRLASLTWIHVYI